MKILFAVEAALGGTGEVVLELSRQLLDQGHEVGLVYSARRVDARFEEGKGELQERGARVEEAALHPYRGPRALIASLKAVRRGGAAHDVVHLHGAWAGLLGRIALWRAGTPVVYSPHGGSFHPRKRGVYAAGRWFERALARRTSAVVVSSAYEESLVSSVIHAHGSVRRIAHGRPGGGSAEPHRLPPAPRFGVVGRVVEEKRLDLAVEALRIVRSTLPEAELIVFGNGPFERELEDLVRSKGLAGAVTMRGFVEQKAEIYRSFDVLLLPSDSEASPLVVAEAQGYGIPAIVTASGGGELAVEDETDGLVVPRGDAESMAEAMKRMAGSPDIYDRFAHAAFAAAAKYQTWHEVSGRYIDLYRETGA